jgi:hypothetical protein
MKVDFEPSITRRALRSKVLEDYLRLVSESSSPLRDCAAAGIAYTNVPLFSRGSHFFRGSQPDDGRTPTNVVPYAASRRGMRTSARPECRPRGLVLTHCDTNLRQILRRQSVRSRSCSARIEGERLNTLENMGENGGQNARKRRRERRPFFGNSRRLASNAATLKKLDLTITR